MDHTSRKNGPEKRKAVEQNEILRQITEKLADIHSRGEVHGKTPSTHELDLEGKWDVSNESVSEWRPAEETQSDDSLKPTQEGDIFSLGCYFYYVITGGQHPFGRSGQRALFIANNLYHLAGCKDPHLQKLIAKMINCDWAKRPKSTELLKHPYLWTSKRTEEYLMEVAKNTDENGDQYEKWKGTILLSDKSAGVNGIRKKTTKVTNVAAVLREIKENKENPTDLCKMFPNLLFSVFSENTGSEIEDEIDESRPETSNELLIANGRYGEVKSVVEIKRRHGRLGLQHVHVIQFPKGDDDTTTKAERLRYLSHENCLQCFYLIENSSEIFMAFEPFNETLETWLKKGDRKPLECDIIDDILCQITKGLVFYHSNKFTHGNLSLSQIVIFEKGTGPDSVIVVKVASFSLNHAKYSPENLAAAMRIDIRELGQVFSYVLSESQQEVPQSHVHLIRAMKELALPSAATVLKHPFLWCPETTAAFLLAAGDYYTQHPNFDKISTLEIAASAPLNPHQQIWKTNREALQAFSSKMGNLATIERTSFVAEWKKQFPKLILQTWLRLQQFKNVSSDDDSDLISFYHPNYDFPEYDELICDEKNLTVVADDTPPPQNLEFGKSEIQEIYLKNFIKREVDKMNQDTSVIMQHIENLFIRTSPLHVACQSDEFYEWATVLMERGFDPNKKDLNGFVPLHVAADKKALKIAKLLIEKKAALEIRDDKYQITPIFFAANNNSASIVGLFIQRKAKINNLDPFGRTPLHFAVKSDSFDAAKTLLEGGADVNANDAFGISSLYIAVDNNSNNMVKLLLNHKGTNPKAPFSLQNADNRIGCVLHLAVARNFPEMVEILLNAGADPNQKNYYGETALHLAAFQKTLGPNRLRIVNLLIEKAAKTNIVDNRDITVLYAAIFNNADEIVNRLLELECRIQVINQREREKGRTPLHLAAMNNFENIVTRLIAKGAKMNAKDNNGLTALEYAAAYNAVDVAKRLLECDTEAIPRYQNKNIRSPLHVAAAYDALDVGKLLISEGADINCVDEFFLTPLHYATFRKNARFIKFLKCKQENVSTASTSAGVSERFFSTQQPKGKHLSTRTKGQRKKHRGQHQLSKQRMNQHQSLFLSKNLSPEELASIPQLINCFEITSLTPNNIQINHSAFLIHQFPNIRLTLANQEIVTNFSFGF